MNDIDIYTWGCVLLMLGTLLQGWDRLIDVWRGLRWGAKSGLSNRDFGVAVTWVAVSAGATLVALDAAGLDTWPGIVAGVIIALLATFLIRQVFRSEADPQSVAQPTTEQNRTGTTA
ncbi:hypothetical protein GL325_14975 [Aeromicrobium sp. 636]|uniref:Uncharacterized protein n=1 Tax=Aeromicrobium senzhongii TaxID=2663859 RepID=A0A8I0EYE1_9ACTN|nr:MULTISPECIES: hypothetical protein [Aeromicrobium]MBC9227630.1 hypothetical protein [Aeromicrobium senzhongii]MCQ3999727.1 hypothetical protein [Aeromicrobium sp. 636]